MYFKTLIKQRYDVQLLQTNDVFIMYNLPIHSILVHCL